MLVIDPEYLGLCFMLIDNEASAKAEKEKPNKNIKTILRTNRSIKKEINKKINANIEKNSITFFSLNLTTKKLLTNDPRTKNRQYRLSIIELIVTVTFKFLK